MSDSRRMRPRTDLPGVNRSIAALRPGDHLCIIYRTDEEHRTILTEYLRRGLDAGERVVYIVDARTAREIRRYLGETDLDVRAAEDSGQLVFLTGDESYTREGVFDPQAMVALLRGETQRALDDAFTGLRVTAEMTWALRGPPGSERLIEYETLLNEFFPGSKATGLCQYDARRFSPDILLDVLRTHPLAVVGTRLYENIYYIPPEELLAGKSDQATLARWLSSLEESQRLTDALQDRARALEERVKELECRRQVHELTSREDLPVPELLQSLLEPIRSGWQCPEQLQVRITLEGKTYETEGFQESPWRELEPLERDGAPVGSLEVAYPAPPEADPFLPEEADLLKAIAGWLGLALEKRHHRQRLIHVNSVLKAIRNVNQLIVRERDPGTLIRRACELLVETREVLCAWIVLLDERGCPTQWGGTGTSEEMEELIAAWKQHGPPECARGALEGEEPVIIEQPTTACPSCPMAVHYGPTFGVAVRLAHEAQVHGVLTVGLPATFAADREELDLLREVAGDIAYALSMIQVGKAQREGELLLGSVFESIQDGMSILDRDLKIRQVNQPMRDWYGENEPLTGKTCYQVYQSREQPCELCPTLRCMQTGKTEREIVPGVPGSPAEWLEVYSYPITDPESGAVTGAVEFVRDITERKATEQALRAEHRRKEALLKLYTLANFPLEELMEAAVNECIMITGSALGFLGYIDEDESVMHVWLWSEKAMADCAAGTKPVKFPLAQAGMWAEPVRTKQPLVVNDFDALDPRKRGLPEGHVELKRYLGVPVVDRGRVVAVAGLGNKEGNYTEEDTTNVQILLEGLWRITARKRTEEELQKSEERFRKLFEESPVALFEEDYSEVKEEMDRLRDAGVRDLESYFREHPEILPAWIEKIRFVNVNREVLELFGARSAEELVDFARQAAHGPAAQAFRQEFVELFSGRSDVEHADQARDLQGNTLETVVRLSVVEGHEERLDRVLVSIQDVTPQTRAKEEVERSLAQVRAMFEGTVLSLGTLTEMRDPYTAGHQRRVAELAVAVAEQLGLPQDRVEDIRIAGLLHDIGKSTVPAEILNKPAGLSDLEFGIIQQHPQAGYNTLKALPFQNVMANIVLSHHERLDGSGYPQGLKGDDISLEVRIVAVADVVEAMVSHRPYRPARGLNKALEEITRNKGTLYDPDVVDACLALFAKGFQFSGDD